MGVCIFPNKWWRQGNLRLRDFGGVRRVKTSVNKQRVLVLGDMNAEIRFISHAFLAVTGWVSKSVTRRGIHWAKISITQKKGYIAFLHTLPHNIMRN